MGDILDITCPGDLNRITEEVLSARIDAVICDPALNGGSDLRPWAPYITIELLRRLHNGVAAYSIGQRGGWSKQAALAKVVANVTGGRPTPRFASFRDFEYPGNAMETAINNYLKQLPVVRKAANASARKHRAKGRDPPPFPRLVELQEKLYFCRYGCMPLTIMQPALQQVTGDNRPPILKQSVPWRAHDPNVQYRSMQEELIQSKQLPQEAPILLRQLCRAVETVDRHDRARERAVQKAQQAEAAVKDQENRMNQIEAQCKEAKKALKRQQNDSAAAMQKLEAKNKVLGAHVARAVFEAGNESQRAAATESRARAELDEAAKREESLRKAKARFAREAREAKAKMESNTFCTPSTDRASYRTAASQLRMMMERDELPFDDNERADPCFEEASRCYAAERDAALANRSVSEAAEAAEAALALKRQREMPTWRAVRGMGAGRGAMKLEWGTRMIIYSLLSMMVPPSAIGVLCDREHMSAK